MQKALPYLKREHRIDWAKAFGICLICVGHFLSGGNAIKVALYSFHVPLFFFISGYLTKGVSHDTLITRIGKMASRLLPCYSFYFLISCIRNIPFESSELIIILKKYLFMTGETIWNAPLWFVPVFFYCNSLFILISHSLSEKQLSLYMPILAAFSFIAAYIFSIMKPAWVIFGVDRVLHMFGYFCIGMMAKPIKKTIEQFSHKQTIIYSIICLLLFLLVSILSSIKNVGNNISILNADYNDFPFYAFIAVISVFTFVFFCSFFPANKLIRLIAENTMFIMCTHYFCRDVWFSVAKRTLLYDLIGGMLTLCVYVAFLYALRRFIVPKLSEKGKFFLRILGIEMGYSDIESLRTPKSDVYDPVQPVESN